MTTHTTRDNGASNMTPMTQAEALAQALRDCLISPNVSDSNFEAANLVDTSQRIAAGTHRIADALFYIGERLEWIAANQEKK